LINNEKNQQIKLETMKSELKQVHLTTNERTKDIIEVLRRPVCEETIKFEVLEEEHDF
jgi:transcriptional regulator of met regulon